MKTKIRRRTFLHLVAGAAALPLTPMHSRAQSYPAKPITVIVPFPAGGPTDLITRIVIEPMKEMLGQPIVVENVGGAGGTIGVARAARAAADGYTISAGQWDTHVVNGAVYPLSYDLLGSFEPLALLSTNVAIIVARKDSRPTISRALFSN